MLLPVFIDALRKAKGENGELEQMTSNRVDGWRDV